MPYSRCSRLTSICMSSRRFLSSAPNGSSSSRTFGIDREAARERDALLLAAGELARLPLGESRMWTSASISATRGAILSRGHACACSP